ncbi:MAG: phosphotransferase [Gammaproteobacteria bacterium]|nr:phosphotransferase [Gammaproteobacteria bacterium]
MDLHEAQAIPPLFGIAATRIEPADSGLINRTFVVTAAAGRRHVLQWVNPIFPEVVNVDIEAVTAHVAGRGLLTPRLLRTPGGALCVPADAGHWRMLTWIDGETVHCAASDQVAREAGRMLGTFHTATADFTQPFQSRRPGVHDTPGHLSRLRETLQRRTDHPRFRNVEPLGAAILHAAGGLPPLPPLPERVVHGDPKISNVLFERRSGVALCMVDLDTVGRMPLPLELGDALRSWCNLAGEEVRTAEFSTQRFAAALEGYAPAAADLLTEMEIASLIPAMRIIHVELAARFCADALNEDYFAWDSSRFGSHSEHSEVRAAGQMDAALAVERQLPELRRIVARILPAGR